MKRHVFNKSIGLLLLLSLIICMSFSFFSFAEAFTGAYLYSGYDPVTGQPITEVRGVNPSGQTFSGENKIEMNAYNNAPILSDNTFNGSTDIDTAFTDITSNANTYNGTTDISYSAITGGNLASSGDTFATTNLEASDADVAFSNPTFNGSVSVNANSVSLGSVSQMDSLLEEIITIKDNLTVIRNSTSASSVTVSSSGVSVTYDLFSVPYYGYSYDSNTHSITSNYIPMYANMLGFWHIKMTGFTTYFNALVQYLTNNVNNLITYLIGNGTYNLYSFSASGEYYSLTSTSSSSNFHSVILNRLDIIVELLNWFCSRFFNWYYPLDNTLPEYWTFYNTDTQAEESIGLAGLMYNISWYLGQLYALQVESGPLTQLAEDVDSAAQSMSSMEAQEEQIISSISSGIDSFVPNLSELGTFTALAWCSNYLQQCWVSLGMYGTVIIIGLLLAVCMQFIGYFRYK